ncbi:MAG: helix-turn-helix domain-containing protein, partial [Alphaproteobacteria bacterium]
MQGSDSTSPHQASEAAQRSKRLFGNQTGGEHGVAKMLREAREGREEEIPQISERLRIRAAYLRAIEEGRYSDLPGDAYAIGFVRAYANYLGLDGEEAVRRFKKEASVSGKATSLVFPIPAREGRAPKGVVLLLSILLALAIYGVWYAITYRADAP